MVAGNMKIITLTNATTSKSQNQNNFLKTNSSISKMNTDIVQNESPKMRYYKGNSYNSSDSVKSLQTPKQCDLNNKSVKKSHSHTLYNIPTTSLSNRKKFYQHRYHHSQQQHTFLNNKKNNKRNITTKNKSLLDSDSTNPIYLDLIAPPLPNQKVAKVDNCLMNVEDLVNNNNTIILDANSSCTPSSNNNNNNCDASSADNSIALSSHRAKTQLKQHAPSTSPKAVEPISDVTLINQHDCISSIKSINLDCNSCWANLVTPQVSESQASLPWPWVHVSRHKSTSVSSTSSYSSSASSSILTSTGSNSDLLQNINAKYTDTTAHTTCPTKKKSFRKGKTSIASRSYNTDRRSSSPHVKGQRKRRTYNIQTTADDLGDTKYSSVCIADEEYLTAGSQKNPYSAEYPRANETEMTTALAAKTTSTTAATTTTVDSTVKTITAENESSTSVESTRHAVIITAASPLSTLTNEVDIKKELATPSVSSETTSTSTVTSTTSCETSSLTATLTTSSNPSTTSTPVPVPTSPNSYSLDFLHSVGVQMTGGANLSALGKNTNTSNMRTNTMSNSQDTVVMSPVRNAYSYQNVFPQRSHTHHARYMVSSGGVGISSNNCTAGAHHTRDQRVHRFQQHHHHPQQLTIASFIQKELLNENFYGGNSRGGNNVNNTANGSGDSSGVDSNTNGNYRSHQRHSYYASRYQQPQSQQQRVPAVQHCYQTMGSSYHSEVGNEGISRITRNGSGNHLHCSKPHMHQNQRIHGDAISNSYQLHAIENRSNLEEPDSTVGQGGVDSIDVSIESSSNSAVCNNMRACKQLQHKLLGTKKPNRVSNATSSCSSSTSSTSSNSSQASTTSYRQQKVKSSTQMNLAIETLPGKINASSHRGNHRLQQFNYHNQQQHSSQQYSSAIGVSQSSTSQQPHQNIYNLTYVNTEGLSSFPNVGMSTTVPTSSCSPSLPALQSDTPGSQPQEVSSSMILSCAPSHYQSQQHQQSFVHDKSLVTPFIMNVSAAHSSSQSASPITVGNMVCYTQHTDSGTSCDSVQPTLSVAGSHEHDCEDSDSSSTNSVAFSHSRNKYNQVKSVSRSSSSSASSNSSSLAANFNVSQQTMSVVDVQHLHSPEPSDLFYNPTFVTSSQHYTAQSQALASPQQQSPFHRNGFISLFNIPLNNNHTDDDLNSIKQQQPPPLHHQQRHFYFAPGEHLNSTSLSVHVGNGGYYSPLHHSSFLYPPPGSLISSGPCPTPKVISSPSISEHDDHNHLHFHHLHHQQQPVNIVNQNEVTPSASHLKRSSTPQMGGGTIISQQSQQHHRFPQSTQATQSGMVATLNSGGSLRQRSGGRSQQQGLQNHQMAAPPPPASISHVYPQHNLLYGGPPTHIRSTANSPHDYFTHTPPDRFLARAHLVEAKEAPSTLLNNSKWDNLSQGVWNKFINSQQTEETFKQKMRLWRYLYIIVKNTYPRFGLYLVGSTISGFGADTSDVDMCLVSRSSSSVEPRMEALFNLTVLRDYLSKSAEFENFNLIEAKVPILRFRDRIHQLEVDLNFNNCVGIKNTHLLYCYSQLDWRLRPMVLVTKLWAQYHNINNAKNMTISSYSLVLMVIHFLQYAVSPAVLPCLHELFPDKFTLLRSNDFGYVDMNETIGSYESKNTQSIGELFLYFLEYYSCFDYAQFAISIRTGGILPINVCRLAKSSKNDIHQWKELCIEEPFDLTNTARSVYDFETFERVKAVFMASWRMLQQTLDLNAIFAPIILPALHHIVSPLSHTVLQYEDSNVSTASEISTRENTTHGSDQNSGTNPSPTVTLLALTNESNKHASKEINNNNSGNSNTVGGSRTELVS